MSWPKQLTKYIKKTVINIKTTENIIKSVRRIYLF